MLNDNLQRAGARYLNSLTVTNYFGLAVGAVAVLVAVAYGVRVIGLARVVFGI